MSKDESWSSSRECWEANSCMVLFTSDALVFGFARQGDHTASFAMRDLPNQQKAFGTKQNPETIYFRQPLWLFVISRSRRKMYTNFWRFNLPFTMFLRELFFLVLVVCFPPCMVGGLDPPCVHLWFVLAPQLWLILFLIPPLCLTLLSGSYGPFLATPHLADGGLVLASSQFFTSKRVKGS